MSFSRVSAAIFIILVSVCLIFGFGYRLEKNKRLNAENALEDSIKESAEARASYERSLATLLSQRASERAITADLVDSIESIHDKKAEILDSIATLEGENEEIKAYLDTAIPDDLAILLENPMSVRTRRVCDADTAAGTDKLMQETREVATENN